MRQSINEHTMQLYTCNENARRVEDISATAIPNMNTVTEHEPLIAHAHDGTAHHPMLTSFTHQHTHNSTVRIALHKQCLCDTCIHARIVRVQAYANLLHPCLS